MRSGQIEYAGALGHEAYHCELYRKPKGTILVALCSQMHIPGRTLRGYVFNTNAMCLEDLGWMKEILKEYDSGLHTRWWAVPFERRDW
jgi:hypothetical protein